MAVTWGGYGLVNDLFFLLYLQSYLFVNGSRGGYRVQQKMTREKDEKSELSIYFCVPHTEYSTPEYGVLGVVVLRSSSTPNTPETRVRTYVTPEYSGYSEYNKILRVYYYFENRSTYICIKKKVEKFIETKVVYPRLPLSRICMSSSGRQSTGTGTVTSN
jgi:hypothetical protein